MATNKVKFPIRRVTVAKGLSPKDGRDKVIKAALRKFGGDYRSATYDPKTGKGTAT